MRRGVKPENEDELVQHVLLQQLTIIQNNHCNLIVCIIVFLFQFTTVNYYTMFALEGRAGEVRWKLGPSDFQYNPVFTPVSHVRTFTNQCMWCINFSAALSLYVRDFREYPTTST